MQEIKLGYEKGEMIILGQPSGLYALAQSETILMDGTFKAVKNKGQPESSIFFILL